MKKGIRDAYTAILSATSMSIGLQDIESILNIILIVLGILNIVVLSTIHVVEKIKAKDYKGAAEETSNAITQISNVVGDAKDKINKGGEQND